jgi:hypothetical protein
MLRRVTLVRTDVSEEPSASSETSVLTIATRRNIPEDTLLLKSYNLIASFIGYLMLYSEYFSERLSFLYEVQVIIIYFKYANQNLPIMNLTLACKTRNV